MTAQIEHRRVTANGITFHVASAGPPDGPAVLLVHGFPEGWMSWRPVMERLPGLRTFAIDTRGYGETDRPRDGYDPFTLTDDLRAVIEALELDRPVVVGHDWGAELGWILGHRSSPLIRGLVIVNGTHPQTLLRASLRFEQLQPLRLAWIPFFQIPWLPEFFFTTRLGRRALRFSFLVREGSTGEMDRELVDELVSRFRSPADLRGPINYYRGFVRTLLSRRGRARLRQTYKVPITAPITVVWGAEDGALPQGVALQSGRDARQELDWRELRGIGHFVPIEAPGLLAAEIQRVVDRLLPGEGGVR